MYMLVEVMNLKDGTTPKAIWEKADRTDAEMGYHQTLASAIANENVTSCLVMILTDRGVISKHEYWERPVPEPEPEPVEETQEVSDGQ